VRNNESAERKIGVEGSLLGLREAVAGLEQ
jgi:hypothetical protein